MCGIEQVLQVARFPTQPPGKGTALRFPGVAGQTQKGPFSNPIPPTVGKGPQRVLPGCSNHSGCVSSPRKVSVSSSVNGAVLPPVWILVGEQETECMKG